MKKTIFVILISTLLVSSALLAASYSWKATTFQEETIPEEDRVILETYEVKK